MKTKTRNAIAGALTVAGLTSAAAALLLSGSAGAATILHTDCPGQKAPVTVGTAGFSCSSEGIVTSNGQTATIRQTLTVDASGAETVKYEVVGAALDFPVALQWNSHAGLSNSPEPTKTVTGTIPAGSGGVTLSNSLVGCGGQQDVKAQPNAQPTTAHISGDFRLAGPVVNLASCQTPPTTVPSTTTPPVSSTVPGSSVPPSTTPASDTTVPSTAGRAASLPATL